MVRERVADNVFIFTSEMYAQVNAGAIIGPDWSVLIDTLAFPEETLEIRDFVEGRLNSPVRYIINTHHHADHILGTCWFPNAVVIGHVLCRELLSGPGREAFLIAQEHNRELRDVRLVLPEIVMDGGEVSLRVGKRTLQLMSFPGHSEDGIGVLLIEDRVLFSGDAMMPIPYVVDGEFDDLVASIKRIPRLKLENLVQGHGEVILRGEIPNAVRANLNYLGAIQRHVNKASRRKDPEGYLATVTIEECGKKRIDLGGLAPSLHSRNLLALYRKQYQDG
jgi:glyoxylase-like metal-dependent hydrolase (beta-lactamase superfamily II)